MRFCRRKDYPAPLEYVFTGTYEEPAPESVVCVGGSVIISPSGAVLAGPNYDGEALITADLGKQFSWNGSLETIFIDSTSYKVVKPYQKLPHITLKEEEHRFHPSSNTTAALQEAAAPPPSAASSAAPSLLAAAASAVYSLLRRSVLLAAVSSADPSSSPSSHLRRVLTSSVFSFNISDFFEIEMIMMLALL
ncbi:hypothetical protein SSX86_008213 [Deinandra increscens subsp. villosa]|uniref:CN hydrolase domain-containing protein n=1 Tax=Deinandra increscens subsp. villosa TaxID=3103831 RepID=A0AAP0DIM9_9ASTR